VTWGGEINLQLAKYRKRRWLDELRWSVGGYFSLDLLAPADSMWNCPPFVVPLSLLDRVLINCVLEALHGSKEGAEISSQSLL